MLCGFSTEYFPQEAKNRKSELSGSKPDNSDFGKLFLLIPPVGQLDARDDQPEDASGLCDAEGDEHGRLP